VDTAHLLIGGTDPAELTRQAPERVAHVHWFNDLFRPVMQRLFALLDAGELGELQRVDATEMSPCESWGARRGTRSSYIYQLEAFIRALRGGPPMPTGPDDAVTTAQRVAGSVERPPGCHAANSPTRQSAVASRRCSPGRG
jgi:hypothetical protein